MSEFRRVQHAERSPTKCLACGDHLGPFVDLEIDLPVYGWVYLCAGTESRPGCIRQIARLDGMVDRATFREMEEKVAELESDIDLLVDRLRKEKVVSLDEILPLIGDR